MIDGDELVCLGIRQRLEQHALNDAENRGVRPDADRERRRSHGREHGHTDEPPQDVLELHACKYAVAVTKFVKRGTTPFAGL